MSASCMWCDSTDHLGVECVRRPDVNWIGSARQIFVHAFMLGRGKGRAQGRVTERARIVAWLRAREDGVTYDLLSVAEAIENRDDERKAK